MTFGISTAGAIMIAGAMAAGASVYSADQQRRATNRASDLQAQASRDALTQQQAEQNQANQRTADTESILEGNSHGNTQSTMLTGANGLTLDDLILGRGTSLLGGRQ